jgi:hypothetical protein
MIKKLKLTPKRIMLIACGVSVSVLIYDIVMQASRFSFAIQGFNIGWIFNHLYTNKNVYRLEKQYEELHKATIALNVLLKKKLDLFSRLQLKHFKDLVENRKKI